jgi:hypothetical protein
MTIYEKINMLQAKSGFMDKYGSDVWATVIICIIFILAISYFYYLNVLEVIKVNWDEEKCSPAVMPFAGFINKPSDKGVLEFTADNFTGCLNGVLKHVASVMLKPFYIMINVLIETFNGLIDSIRNLRVYFETIRNNLNIVFDSIKAMLMNVAVYFMELSFNVKDALGKINGILTSALYSLISSYMALQSLFLVIIDILIYVLIGMAVLIVFLLFMTFIPILGLPFVPPLAVATAAMTALFVIVIQIKIMMDRIMDLSTPNPPDVPTCFAGNTPVELKNGVKKNISDVAIGDCFKDDTKVVGIIKGTSRGQQMYSLYDIFVTGEHRVFYNNKLVKVKDHPDSLYLPHYPPQDVYCLLTDTKMFTINGLIFSDWDDIDADVLFGLDECGYLPPDYSLADIHTYFDSGFHSSASIALKTGENKSIKDINVADVLASGETVRGIVKIAAHDMLVYHFRSANLISSKNIHIDDPNLGIIEGLAVKDGILIEPSEPYLYHLLTDTGFFVVNNVRVHDYNYAIDAYCLPVPVKPASVKSVPASVKPVSVKPASVKPASVKPVSVKPVSVKPVPAV